MSQSVDDLPIGYLRLLSLEDHSIYNVDTFVKLAPWEQKTSARLEAFWSKLDRPYTYGQGRGERTYHPSPFPEWMSILNDYVEHHTDCTYDLCFLNRYDSEKQHLGWHADDSPEQDMDCPIAVVSFGAEREIWFRENGARGEGSATKLLLSNGSILIMHPGMQQTHQHRIPKHPQPCGTRVSLTYRALKK